MQDAPNADQVPWRPDASHLEGLSAAVVTVDRESRIRYCNDAARTLYGHSSEALLGASLPALLFAEKERGAVGEVLKQALGGGHWRGDLPIVDADGVSRAASLTCSPVWENGEITGALLVAEARSPSSADRVHAHRLADRLTRLARVTTELMMADNIEAVTKIVIEHSAVAAGATVASLSLLVDPDTLALIGLRGAKEGAASRWATFPVSADTPASEAVRTGERVVLSGLDMMERRYPGLERAAEGERSMVCLPLKITGRSIGVMSMSFPGRRTFDTAELEFFGVLADTCAQAIDRINAVVEAADQAAKLRFLADASEELASSLDYQATLTNVARMAVPNFADWCSIQLAADGVLRTLAVAHVDPAKVALAEELQRRYPPDPDDPRGAYNVLRTGVSDLIPEIPDELLVAATQDEEHLRLARELNLRSALSVPLKARGRVLGVITWVTGDTGRRFGPSDLVFGEDLARRAAIAIDNSQLHSETRETAIRLQRAVLPEGLPSAPGWDLAASYSPAGRTEVGGDFYDAVPLPDGTLAMFVGDVMGRGFSAAAAMATMRAAVRAFVAVDPSPEAVMTKLDVMFSHYDVSQLVTLVYAVADPASSTLTFVNAGHPPPIVIRADGSPVQLPTAESAPLSVGSQVRTALTVDFHPGDTVLAFTDGLIERRTEDIDHGQRRLLEHGGLLRNGDLAQGLERLVDLVRDHTRDDDVAGLAARRTLP